MRAAAVRAAAELLEQCDLTRPGILLLDVMMPGMTGLDLQESLLARGITSPVIFLTGSHSIPIAVAAIQRGAVDFVEVRRACELDALNLERTLEPPSRNRFSCASGRCLPLSLTTGSGCEFAG